MCDASPGLDPFCLQSCSIRCWKHPSEIWVHTDMIASHCCCRSVGCTPKTWISCFTTYQRCSVGLKSGDSVERELSHQISGFLSCPTWLRWCELCDKAFYPEGRRHQRCSQTNEDRIISQSEGNSLQLFGLCAGRSVTLHFGLPPAVLHQEQHVWDRCHVGRQSDDPDPVFLLNAWGFWHLEMNNFV